MSALVTDPAVDRSEPSRRPKRRWPLRLLVLLVIGAVVAGGYVYYENVVRQPPDAPKPASGHEIPVVIGAVPYWDEEEARQTIDSQSAKLDVASPWSYSVAEDGTVELQPGLDSAGEAAQAAWLHERGLKVIPTIANTTEGLWDPATVSTVINDPDLRSRHVRSIVDLTGENGYDGIQIDYEDLPSSDRDAFSAFITDLGAAMHSAGKLLYVTVHVKEDDAGYDARNRAQDYAAIGQAADMVCLMAYDWHWSTGPAGPIAPYDWVERVLRYSVTQIPAEKIILGVGLFGYDWVGTKADNLTWRQVLALASQYQVDELWDVGGQSPHFSYVDEAGQQHEVWYENGRSAAAKFDLARRYELGGIELWRMGGEDPSIWEPGP